MKKYDVSVLKEIELTISVRAGNSDEAFEKVEQLAEHRLLKIRPEAIGQEFEAKITQESFLGAEVEDDN